MKIVAGSTYRIYGKTGSMKRMAPMAGTGFVFNLIYAELFYLRNDDDVRKFTDLMDSLQVQGKFEAREVKTIGSVRFGWGSEYRRIR